LEEDETGGFEEEAVADLADEDAAARLAEEEAGLDKVGLEEGLEDDDEVLA
jgi:hypothetical protein